MRLGDLGKRLLIAGLEIHDLVALRAELRLGAVKRDLERIRLQAEEHLSCRDRLVLMHIDLVDDTRDIGGKPDHVGLDIGVVGRHHLAAIDVIITANGERHRQQGK